MDVKMEGENDESIQSKLLDFSMKDVGTFTQDDFDHVLRYISAYSSRNTFNLASQVIEKCCEQSISYVNASLIALTQALTDALQSHVVTGSEDPRSEDFPNLSAAQTMTALCQQYHKTKANDAGVEFSPIESSLVDRLNSLLEAKGVCGEDASATLLSRELKKVIALINRQLRKSARALDGHDEDNLTDVDDTVNDDDADHVGMVVAETKEDVTDGHRDHDRDKGGDTGNRSNQSLQQAPPLPSEPFNASSSSSSAPVSRTVGTYKKLVNDDGTLISENILHKDQRGVVMVFEELTPRQVEALSFLVTSFPRTRWLEICGRLRSFYKPNITTPTAIEKCMRLNRDDMKNFMSLAGFHCKPEHIISADNFNKLQLVAANLCDNDYVDRADVFLKTEGHAYGSGTIMGDRGGGDRGGGGDGFSTRKRGRDDGGPGAAGGQGYGPGYGPQGVGESRHHPPLPPPSHHHPHHMGSGGGGDYSNPPSRGGPGLGDEDMDHHRNQRNRPNPSADAPRDSDHHRGGGHDRGGDRERYGSGGGGLMQGDGPTRPFVHDHDDATPSLLMRNLPPDVTCAELVTLITKHTSCGYIEEKDIAIPPVKRGNAFFTNPDALTAETGAHAYINFHHLKDSRNAKKALDGKIFGGRSMEIDYSMGRATKVVWVGGLGPPGQVTERMIDDKMRVFGRIESVDIKRRVQHNDAFAFVVFEDLRDSQRAVKSLGGSTTINGVTVRIGYSSSAKDAVPVSGSGLTDRDHGVPSPHSAHASSYRDRDGGYAATDRHGPGDRGQGLDRGGGGGTMREREREREPPLPRDGRGMGPGSGPGVRQHSRSAERDGGGRYSGGGGGGYGDGGRHHQHPSSFDSGRGGGGEGPSSGYNGYIAASSSSSSSMSGQSQSQGPRTSSSGGGGGRGVAPIPTQGSNYGGQASAQGHGPPAVNANPGGGGGSVVPLGLLGLPGLALVSSEEAHRKDLRYLTVTKATCEADVDFVLKECEFAGAHQVVGVSKRDFTVTVLFAKVEAALTARDEIMVRNPSLEHKLTPAPQTAAPLPVPTPTIAQSSAHAMMQHDDNDDDVEVYWTANNNNNNNGQSRPPNRR